MVYGTAEQNAAFTVSRSQKNPYINLESAISESIGVSDCDYQTIKNMGFAGKSEVTLWLRQRIADHDHLSVNGVFGGSAIEPTVFGVDFSQRTSDTLRRLGFPNGIRFQGTAKVILTSDLKRIDTVALGPGPLNDGTPCRPQA